MNRKYLETCALLGSQLDFCELQYAELVGSLVQDGESVSLPHEETAMTNEQDIKEGQREWTKEYDHYMNNPPQEGEILKAVTSDASVKLVVELVEEKPPFIYGRAYVPEIVGHALGWFLQDTESSNFHGWKCILLPRARTEAIRRLGLSNEVMEVKSLKLIRYSKSKKAMLCEVHEFCDTPQVISADDMQPSVDGPADEIIRPGDGIPEPGSVDPEHPAV